MCFSRLSNPSRHWASALRLLCSAGIVAGFSLATRASDALEIEIRQTTTSMDLGASPNLLALSHYQSYTLIEDWQAGGTETSGQPLGQPKGVTVAPDGTIYLPTTYGLGWKPPGSHMRWKQNLPLPIEAATSDPESHLILAAAGSLQLFPEDPDGIRISIVLPPEVRQGVRLATEAHDNTRPVRGPDLESDPDISPSRVAGR